MAAAQRYGLIGYPLGHSFSERYFAGKFVREGITGVEYRNFPLESIESLPGMLASQPDLRGFNVTIPYKEAIIPYLDELDDESQAIGAVNCVRIDGGRLYGYNTDAYGFRVALLDLIGEERPAALVLGTGGSSKAVRYALRKLEIDYLTVSRTAHPGGLTYRDLNEQIMASHRLIVNTTPLGMAPNLGSFPNLPYQYLAPGHFLFDLVYNPPITQFLAYGAEHGAATRNGYDMLVAQAEKSWEIWTQGAIGTPDRSGV